MLTRPALTILLMLAAARSSSASLFDGPSKSPQVSAGLEASLLQLEKSLPRAAEECAPDRTAEIGDLAQEVETAAAEIAGPIELPPPDELLANTHRLLSAKSRVDRELERILKLRAAFVALPQGQQRSAMLAYLHVTADLIDLSGRLRYTLYDAISEVAAETVADAKRRERLIDDLLEHRSSIGAAVMLQLLSDDFVRSERGAAVDVSTKKKLLELAAKAGQPELLQHLAAFARSKNIPPELAIETTRAIREIGLPQDPRPGQDPELPKPVITAVGLLDILRSIDHEQLDPEAAKTHTELVGWLDARARDGITGDALRMSGFDVRPGDWLLMRNPSPYNLFTDLSPGLFTHVGVVAAEVGSDGIRRIVIVDLPEKGTRMPATNADIFIQRTLHFAFLRHEDPEVAAKMADVAASTIGLQSEFDLNFKTDRVGELRGQPLDGRVIHTYCAGLLLLCAQETSAPRQDFFPVIEYPARGNTVENLKRIGITFGDNFVSPSGALFSPRLEIVGRREPMYDPRREVEEAIFDYFAKSLVVKTLTPSPNWYQSLRARAAAAADLSPTLAKAAAALVDAPKQTDLASAAKAAAVIETLDEIAFSSSGDFLAARQAILAGPIAPQTSTRTGGDQLRKTQELRNRHAGIVRRWEHGDLTPRELRVELLNYYIQRGKQQLDERFFSSDE